MKRAAAPLLLLLLLLLLLALTGCGGSDFEQMEKDAAFAEACEEEGGRVTYYGLLSDQLECYFGDR